MRGQTHSDTVLGVGVNGVFGLPGSNLAVHSQPTADADTEPESRASSLIEFGDEVEMFKNSAEV